MELFSPMLTWLQLPLSVQSANRRYSTEFPIWHYSPGRSANYLVPDWLSWTVSIMEGAEFYSYCNKPSGYRFASPSCNTSAKTTIPEFKECLMHRHGILHSMLLFRELTSHHRRSSNAHALILPYPPTPSKMGLWISGPSPKPNPGLPLFVIRPLCLSAWISIAYFQTLCHHGLPTCWDTICYTLLVFLDSFLPFAFQDCLLLLPTSFSLNNKPTGLAGLSPISWNKLQFQLPLSHWWACPVFNKQTNLSLYHQALILTLDYSMPYKIFKFNRFQA